MNINTWLLIAVGLITIALLVYVCAQARYQRKTQAGLKTARDALVTELNTYNSDQIVQGRACSHMTRPGTHH